MERRSFLKMLAAAPLVVSAPSLLTACGGGGESSSNGKLQYWLWQDNATDQTWQKLADEFNGTHKTNQVELQVVPLAQYEDKLLTALSSGGGPDAARFKDWWVGQFTKSKALAPLGSRIDSWSGKSDVVPALFKTGQVTGESETYMLPHQYVTLYLYYRKSAFSALGLPAPRTHADVLAAAGKLAGAGKNHYGIDVRGGSGGQDQWAAWMYSGGAHMVDSTGKVVLNDSTGVATNQDYLDIHTKLHAAPPGSVTASFAQVQANFQAGTTAMMIHHTGSLGALRPQLGADLGVVAMPSVDPSNPSTLGTMSGNVIMASSKKQDQAWEWISWLDSQAPMLTMSTSKQGQLPVLQSVASNAAFTKDEAYKIALDAEKYAQTWPSVPGTATVSNKDWGPNIQAAFLGSKSSSAMLDALADDLAKS
jgi:multiple sugar transport system substrate-binding protein